MSCVSLFWCRYFPPLGTEPRCAYAGAHHTAFRKDPGPPRATVNGDREGVTAAADAAATTTGGEPEPHEGLAK